MKPKGILRERILARRRAALSPQGKLARIQAIWDEWNQHPGDAEGAIFDVGMVLREPDPLDGTDRRYQTEMCGHVGIGLPGCLLCDPRPCRHCGRAWPCGTDDHAPPKPAR